MYRFAKSIALKIFSPSQLFSYEVLLRRITGFFYSGTAHQCTVCSKKLRKFISLPNGDLLCPSCGSLSRDRRLWQMLDEKYLGNGMTVLDFSPSRCLARMMKKKDINYLNTDLSGNFLARYNYDITALPLEDNSIDLIICYHILEHIDNDAKAINELYRVLKPGCQALVQTPFKESEIYENPEITTPRAREQHFGQDDHVRIYSVSGLKERLEKAGFSVRPFIFNADSYHGFTPETVLELTKP